MDGLTDTFSAGMVVAALLSCVLPFHNAPSSVNDAVVSSSQSDIVTSAVLRLHSYGSAMTQQVAFVLGTCCDVGESRRSRASVALDMLSAINGRIMALRIN